MLAPNFDTIPAELVARNRWVLWRDRKVPYNAAQPRRRASCTDSRTWASFATARTAYKPERDCGIGFVLGDGIAGVDIDHDTSEAAQFLLEITGCAYIETSPSGRGLHGFALSDADLPRSKGFLDGLHVEVYNADRYFTVTGNALATGPLIHANRILRLSEALQRESKMTRLTESTETCLTESYESPESPESYESPEDHVRRVITNFLPTKAGERNSKLFDWCRHMKTIHPEATVQQQVEYARQWYNAAEPVIGTKDPSVSIADFLRGWEVALPENFDMAALVAEAAKVPVPALIADALGDAKLTFGLCVALQRTTGTAPFYMPTRKLGTVIGKSWVTAASGLRILRALNVLIVSAEGTRTKSPRYYVAPEYLA